MFPYCVLHCKLYSVRTSSPARSCSVFSLCSLLLYRDSRTLLSVQPLLLAFQPLLLPCNIFLLAVRPPLFSVKSRCQASSALCQATPSHLQATPTQFQATLALCQATLSHFMPLLLLSNLSCSLPSPSFLLYCLYCFISPTLVEWKVLEL